MYQMIKRQTQNNSRLLNKSRLFLFTGFLPVAAIFGIKGFNNKAVQTHAASSATENSTITLDGINLSLDQNLKDNGDGTYSIKLTTSSFLRYEDFSAKNNQTKYGYFKAQVAGDYLFEVYGGDGGTGENSRYSQGGQGGKGAHLFATLSMDKGDYIFYTIGGNGQQTVSSSTGGGANGDGGDHGDNGSYAVGGGGGFSAVYYFDKNHRSEFEANYLSGTELIRTDVLEKDRISKYIMIAGGGGGGGAGNAFSVSDKAIRTPDGGNAGGFNSPSGTLEGASYAVSGTYYSGSNGYSSGKKQDYIGKGGSNVPGEVNSTFLEFFDGKQPNDWEGTANSKFPGGSGGSGNLRGGAGGAGYAGGSGGIMTGLLIGTNVGGGGGGSSFIASKMSTNLTALQEQYLSNYNDSSTGGSVYISYVPDESSITSLNNIGFSFDVSKYFEIVSGDTSSTQGTLLITGNKVTVTGAKATPKTSISAGIDTVVALKVKPKDTFMGGNDVPIFDNNSIKYTYTKAGEAKTFSLDLKDKTKYVNVPYNFDLVTNSFTGTCEGGNPYNEKKASDLYVDNGYINELSKEDYDFIDNVTDYTVQLVGGKTYTKNETISVTETKTFNVSFTVTPKTGSKAIVGERLTERVFSKTAKIAIVPTGTSYLNGNEMHTIKSLNYDSDNNLYNFKLNVQTSIAKKTTPERKQFKYASSSSGTYNVPESAFYLLEVWGGKGGQGGNGYFDETGGSGGNGGYVTTALYLTKGTVLSYANGANGSKGSKADHPYRVGDSGYGGKKSTLQINGVNIIIAGGGGGGGGGGSGSSDGSPCTEYGEGTDGETSRKDINFSAQTSDPGTNYINSDLISSMNSGHGTVPTYEQNISRHDFSGGGAFYISYLSGLEIDSNLYKNYSIIPAFTSNFEVANLDIENATATKNGNSFTNIIPKTTTDKDGNIVVNFSAKYVLKPLCLGGNDIKLLDSLKLTQTDCNGNTSDDSINIPAQDATDYANVKINESLLNTLNLTTNDFDYVQGSTTGVDASSLATGSSSPTFVDPNGKLELSSLNIDTNGETELKPNETTNYYVSYGIQATADPEKAVVGPTVDPLYIYGSSTINVYHAVNYQLKHLSADAEVKNINGENIYLFNPGKPYVSKITADSGWKLPSSIEVIVDGSDVTDSCVDYKKDEISIEIPANLLTNTSSVEIRGDAIEETYTIHYLVSLDKTGLFTKDFTTTAYSGENIESKIDDLISSYDPSGKVYNGYTFTIEYPNGSKPTEMPASDIWINGVYNPNPHKLTVHYVDQDGKSIVEDFVDSNSYNMKEYSLTAEKVDGYAPSYVEIDGTKTDLNPANPQFVMPDKDLDLYIYYVSTTGKVVVNYTCKDDIELPETKVVDDLAPGDPYSIPSPSLTGYIATPASVEGQVSSAGQSYTINYEPEQYKISFDSDGGTVFSEQRTVFYNHEIGYTGTNYEEATYEPLPIPVKVGYTFKGWFINGTKVDESTVYTSNSDVILKAKWEKKSFTITFHYGSDNTTGAFKDDVTVSGYYGDSYSYSHENVEGYTAPATTTGTFGASNTAIDLTYNVNYHDVVLKYKDNNGNLLGEKTISDVKYGTSVDAQSDFNNSNYEFVSSDSTSFTMPDHDVEVTFIYKLIITSLDNTNTTVTVKPTSGDKFVYGNTGNDPVFTVVYNGETLTNGTDFDVDFAQPYDKDTAGDKNYTIKFKGKYSGSITGKYTVEGKKIADDKLSITGVTDKTYTGSAIEQELVVKDGDTTLVQGTDYTLSYENNINAGKATVTVNFINNYSNTPSKSYDFMIKGKTASSVSVEGVPESENYTGSQIKPEVTAVKDGATTLTEGKDYVVIYGDNTDVGKGTVTIKFINNYSNTETVVKTFNIKPVSGYLTVSDINNSFTYNGSAYTPKPSVKYNGEDLVEGTDYYLEYKDNTNAGQATVTVHFINDYADLDSVDKNFTINSKNGGSGSTSSITVLGTPDEVEYTGSQIKPEVTVIDGSTVLKEGTDYTVTYGENTNVGKGTIAIEFINNYASTPKVEKTFTIKANQSNVLVSEITGNFPYTGSSYTPEPTVTYNSNPLSINSDYTLSYENNINAGTATVTVTFKGNYSSLSSITKEFTITPTDISNSVDVSVSPSEFTYNGTAHEPEVIVTYGGDILILGTDFEVAYSNNIDVGTGKATVTFIGNYEGTLDDLSFTIKPATIDSDKLDHSQVNNHEYDGEPYNPTPDVYYNGAKLIPGTDFDYDYEDNVNAGNGNIIIKFKGNYANNDDYKIPFVIDPVDMDETKLSSDPSVIPPHEYDGNPYEPKPDIYYNGHKLEENKDFIYKYEDNENVPGGKIIIEFIGNYEGNDPYEIPFKITSTDISGSVNVTISQDEYTYDGTAHEPEVTVTYGSKTLNENIDFTLTYSNNVDAGTGKVTVHFIGNYEGTEDEVLSFAIKEATIDSTKLDHSQVDNHEYDGKPYEPKPDIYYEGEKLIEGKDFEYKYEDNTNVPGGSIIIEFIGNYKGNDPYEIPFVIDPVDMDENKLSSDPSVIDPHEYDGNPYEPKPEIYYEGEKLEEGKDFNYIYEDNENAPGGKVIIEFIGNYEGNDPYEIPFEITPADVSDSLETDITQSSFIYNGEEQKPSPVVKDGDTVLEEGKDYYVTYSDNTNPGTGAATITFIGNYASTDPITETFSIKPTVLDNAVNNEDPTVSLSYDGGFDTDITLVVELKEDGGDSNPADFSILGGDFYETYGSYSITLYRNGEEIQPSDIEEGAVLTLKIAVPEGFENTEIKIVHLHSNDDITVIVPGDTAGIGTYIIEGGYIVTQIDKLSDFSIIYEQACFAHYFLFAIALLDLILLISLLILGKKPSKSLGIFSTASLIVLTAVCAVFAHCMICNIMFCVNGGLLILNLLFFTLFKRKENDNKEIVYVEAPAKVANNEVEQAPVIKEEPKPVVEPVVEKETKPEEPIIEEPKADLTLKESIIEAKANTSELVINKKIVAKWLKDTYGEEVTVNNRENMTSTGLPLGDTHYMMVNGQKKCFIYVYEIDGKCFFIVRGDENVAKNIKDNKHPFIKSAFPKTRDYAKWYTMVIDNSYSSSEDVFNTLKLVISNLAGNSVEEKPVVENIVEEIPQADLSLKESIEQAKGSSTKLDITKQGVADFLAKTYGKNVAVNVRENMTSTGLPLADTHYMLIDGKGKCFIYVYVIEGKTFFIVRGDENVAKLIRGMNHKFISSAFPKTRDYAKWYTMLIDDTYANNDEVYDVLKLVVGNLNNNYSETGSPVQDDTSVKADLSLKDSIKEAKTLDGEFKVDKNIVAKFLTEKYGNDVVVNVRENMTSTGLPLADTHYMMVKGEKKCFMYVYDVEGKCFFILRGNDEIAQLVRNKKHKFISSAFPKTRDYAKWYTMLIDDSYKNINDVFETLDEVIKNLK